MKQLWIVTGLLLAYATPGCACKCAPSSPDLTTRLARAESRIKQAQVIFEGKVEKIDLKGWPLKPQPGKTIFGRGDDGPKIQVRFSGSHIYRGEPKGDLVIETGLGMGDCGYPFEPGQSYLVYAWTEDSGVLSTGICSGTTPLGNAGTALRLLRGDPPTPGDLADLGNEDAEPNSNWDDIKLCGKVSFPQGSKARPLKMVLWHANRDASPLPHDTKDSEADGSFCFHDVDSGAYVLEALELSEESSKYRYTYAGFYPGVKDRAQAKPLVVKERGDVPGADFPVLRIPLHRIKGYLRGVPDGDNDQVIVNQIMVMITAEADPFPRYEPVHLGPHGTFEFPGCNSRKILCFCGQL